MSETPTTDSVAQEPDSSDPSATEAVVATDSADGAEGAVAVTTEPTEESEVVASEGVAEGVAPEGSTDEVNASKGAGTSAGASEPADEAADDAAELVDEGEVAADYLEGLLDIADLDGDIDIAIENGRPAISVIEVNSGDLAHLVGDDGAVLSALQDLTRLAVTRETGHRSRLMLDVAGHRATRRTELQRLAQQGIAEAKESGAPVRMAAMTAFERKVVHDEVAAAGLTSESEGSEPQRYVVITPA